VTTTSSPQQLADDIAANTRLSLWSMLQRSVESYDDRTAVQMGARGWTYRELHDRSLRSAAALAELGVGKGTRVAFIAHACPEWAVLHYALMRLGAVAVPINLAFEAEEIRHVLRVAEPELVVSIASFRGVDFAARLTRVEPGLVDGSTRVASLPSIRWVGVVPLTEDEWLDPASPSTAAVFGPEGGPLAEPGGAAGPEDPSYIIFTSGSTAFPKPALCTHRAFLGAATGFEHALLMGPEDRFLTMLPTFHVGGVTCALTAPHLDGGCTDLMGGFDPVRALDTIQRSRSTCTVGFDTMWTKILGSAAYPGTDVSSLRKAVLACTPTYIDRLRELWHFDLFTTTYGSTESGTLAAMVPAWTENVELRTRTNGRPLPGLEIKVVDPETGDPVPPGELGEICFRGWCRVVEYVGMPEETAAAIDADGYFHSGDYGALDADGWLYFRGRYKQMIKSGGENVSEREVEVFLEDHLPQVEFAQVVGVTDDTWGEAVVAFVALSEPVGSEELRRACAGAISGFKIPKQFIPLDIDAFPVLANGRPDKNALRALAVAHRASLADA
jgi:fatty-acyl-CoA synthase